MQGVADQLQTSIIRSAAVDLFQPVSKFVIARNLVRRLENAPETRHPILIELASADHQAQAAATGEALVKAIKKLTGRS